MVLFIAMLDDLPLDLHSSLVSAQYIFLEVSRSWTPLFGEPVAQGQQEMGCSSSISALFGCQHVS